MGLKNKKLSLESSKIKFDSLLSKKSPKSKKNIKSSVKIKKKKHSLHDASKESSESKTSVKTSSSEKESLTRSDNDQSKASRHSSSPKKITSKIKKHLKNRQHTPGNRVTLLKKGKIASHPSKVEKFATLEELIKEAKFDGEAYLIDFSKVTPLNFKNILKMCPDKAKFRYEEIGDVSIDDSGNEYYEGGYTALYGESYGLRGLFPAKDGRNGVGWTGDDFRVPPKKENFVVH